MHRAKQAVLVVVLAICGAAMPTEKAAASTECMEPAGTNTVTATDGYASLTLSDGAEIRLADIVPASAYGVDGSGWPALRALFGRSFNVMNVPGKSDRYGRRWGDLVAEDTGESVLDTLLRQGLALVDPTVMSGHCVDALFAAEREAEAGGHGVWGTRGFVRSAGDEGLADDAGRYALVEGVVVSVGETRNSVYLNFGETYSHDFTVLVRKGKTKDWVGSLKALSGQRVRVRGVLDAWNGGMILVEHDRQIERRPARSAVPVR
ncbi:MAG: thermonuclease family protein [Pseudomonadota bacterium]